MSAVYDKWERLVDVVLRREHDRELALCSSRDLSSISSNSSGLDFEIRSSNSRKLFLHEQSGRLSDYTFNRRKWQEFRSIDVDSRCLSLKMDFSDLTLHRDKWKEMLDPGERQLIWPSSFLSFFIDDRTGNNCFLLGATKGGFESGRDWGPVENFNPRSIEAVALSASSTFDIQCKINAKIFSAPTIYAAYLVFKSGDKEEPKLDFNFSITRSAWPPGKQEQVVNLPKRFTMRDDDEWMQLAIGGFHIDETDNDTIELCVQETSWRLRSDIHIQGIEFRPIKFKRSSKPDKGIFSRLRKKMDHDNSRMR